MVGLGCAGTPEGNSPDASGSAASTPSATSVASLPTAAPSAAPSASSTGGGSSTTLVGTWVSPSCGGRKYPRELTLDAGGHFSSRDLVSPCPPKAVCVWSGIVVHQGTYTSTSTSLKLVPDPDGSVNGPGEALVTELSIVQGAPMEAPDHDRCAYARAP